MWSATVILSAVTLFYQVLCGEIPDVTTVYKLETPPPQRLPPPQPPPPPRDNIEFPLHPWNPHYQSSCKVTSGRVHSRTNSLGMGLIDKTFNFMDTIYSNNITFDLTGYIDHHINQWSFENGSRPTLTNVMKQRRKIQTGNLFKIRQHIVKFGIQNLNDDIYIVFTNGPQSLTSEKIHFVIRLKRSNGSPDLFYNCYQGEGYGNYLINGYRDGVMARVFCNHHLRDFQMSYDSDVLTFDFNRRVELYRGMGESKKLVLEWSYEDYQDISNYFIMKPFIRDDNADSFFLAINSGVEVNNQNGIVSMIFTPQTVDICLSILFNSSISSPSSELEISVFRSRDQEYSLASIENVKSGWNVKVINKKLRDTSPINLKIQKTGTAGIIIARIAFCNPEGEEVMELPAPFPDCPLERTSLSASSLNVYNSLADFTESVEKMRDTNKKCWNGGELTSAGCACPPGFAGLSCEIGCGRNRFGQDCEGLCSLRSEECQGLLMCTKFTDCHCAPGFTGLNCSKACSPGWYGNDCSQQCGRCAENSPCDIYTGKCTSCKEGYLAPYCKLVSPYYGSKPDVTSPWYGTVVVSFDPNNYITVTEPPQLYQIEFRKTGEQWQVYTTKPLQKVSETSEKERKMSEKIEGLNNGVVYQVRIIMMDYDLIKYDGDLVQVAEVLSKCDVPVFHEYKLTSTANTSSITFSWKYAIVNEYTCPLKTFEVSWREGWKWPKDYTKNKSFTLTGLRPGAVIRFKVRAITTGGPVPYSEIITTSTQHELVPSVQNLHVESRQSTSVKVSWDPPIESGDEQLQYTISYKCVDRPACSQGCQNVTEGQLTQEGTGVTLSPLIPFTKYLVTVSAEGGAESSIFAGTSTVVPTEVPVLSAQRPVRTNTSLTVFWDQVPVCTGYLLGYNYQLTKASDNLKILASGFTKETNISFHNLTASTEYVVRVFVSTVAGWNPVSYLSINVNTSATVPELVRNLTVYKRGRGMMGLRWAEPRATYGQLKSFTVTHSLGQEVVSHTVEPSHCVVWPELYCHTIEGLRSNRRYNVSVSARNSEVAEDGDISFVSAVTKESSPSAPVSLKVVDSSSTSIKLEWDYPDMANGIVRSFLISVEETEKYDQDNCCQIYPFVETSVKEESKTYSAEVSGLHPASTYFVSVSAKTVGLGPPQSLAVSTRPPHLPLTSLPRVQEPEVSWQPQDKLPEVNNSDIYTSLVRATVLLAVPNENQSVQFAPESRITDTKLDSLLQQRIGKPFYFIAEYNQDDDVEISGPLEDNDSPWGRPPASLSPEVVYQLVATQVLEYNGVYNVDLRYSLPFTLYN